MATTKRNVAVERTVDLIVNRIDAFIEGEKLNTLPSAKLRGAIDDRLKAGGSIRVATLFFSYYASIVKTWDFNSVPTGIRGKWGDKILSDKLALRDITLHGAITAFAENIGWKGNVSGARLQGDRRFDTFILALAEATPKDRSCAADYIASKFADSRRVVAPLPPVSDDVLTYARARLLFYELVTIPSEGNIQQFLIAALLHVHRTRYGHEIRTHHVHASDKFDTTAGDIEEFRDGDLIRAYEVTVRPDWKSRVSAFRDKMDKAGLKKYTIIASNVLQDDELAEPADMIRFLEPYGRDIAVVDIHELVDVFAMELTATELRTAVNQAYSYLTAPKLCGRSDVIEKFSACVAEWLDQAAPTS